MAVLITLLDNFPYGFLLFPGEVDDTSTLGVSMVLLSAAMAQMVFAVQSSLPVGPLVMDLKFFIGCNFVI